MATTGKRAATKYLLRKCAEGSASAFKTVKKLMASELISIQAGATFTFAEAEAADDDHPNRMPFKGVLLILDAPSTKPPHGSRGHRIYVPKKAAEKQLSGIIGMAVNYDPHDLDSHVTRHKVGIITKAWIKGNQVWVKGFCYKKDFPEVARDLKQGGLGMSMELANVYVRDENEDVWHLEDFSFTGATILKKSAAAYYQTELVANAGKLVRKPAVAAVAASGITKGESMAQAEKKGKMDAAASDTNQGALLVSAMKGAITEAVTPLLSEIKASNERQNQLSTDLEELKGLYMIQAAASEEDDDEEMSAAKEDDDDEEMSAAGKGKHDDEEDDDEDDEDGEDDDLDAMEDLEEEAVAEGPGEINKKRGDENKGDKSTVTDPPTQREKVPGNIAKGRLKSSGMKAGKKVFPGLKSSASIQAAAAQISTLYAQVGRLKRDRDELKRTVKAQAKANRKLGTKLDAVEAQASQWAEQVNRRSVVPVEIRNLMAKANLDVNEMQAKGERLTVGNVDNIFAALSDSGIQVDVVKRAELKNRMYQLGLMESGEIN